MYNHRLSGFLAAWIVHESITVCGVCVHALTHACACACMCLLCGSGNNLLIDVYYTTIRIPPLGLRVPDKSVKLTS